jgi:hypothetical protein
MSIVPHQIDLVLNFGNHKGACKAPDKLRALLHKDIIHEFNLPAELLIAHRIQGLVLLLMNLAPQNTIDEKTDIETPSSVVKSAQNMFQAGSEWSF